jgi:hypothetical protein
MFNRIKAEHRRTQQSFSRIPSFADISDVIEYKYRQHCKRFLQLEISFSWSELQPCLNYVFDDLQTSKYREPQVWQLFFKGLTKDHVMDLMQVGQLFLGVETQVSFSSFEEGQV